MEATKPQRRKVAVIYHMFPHYRAPILRALAASDKYEFVFWGSHTGFEGIKCFSGDDRVTVQPLATVAVGRGFRVPGMVKASLTPDVVAVILLGNPNIRDSWIAAIFARLAGKKVFFWSHGWLKREGRVKSLVRKLYFSLANGVLTYDDRSKRLAQASGFPTAKVFPIYNSLDWDASDSIYQSLNSQTERGRDAQEAGSNSARLVCTARLTVNCEFEILLVSMRILQDSGWRIQLTLIGDGPERERLEALARDLNLEVDFLGAIYDEPTIARHIYTADATISPGKVGLTAMHSMTYGTPVVTHGDFDQQMPEVEAVVEGVTGRFFNRGDPADLARAIDMIVRDTKQRDRVRNNCRSMIAEKYTPGRQRELIERALDFSLEVRP